MTNPTKAKGRDFEREFARSAGGKRTPLSGAAGGGDVSFAPGEIWGDWSWELKRRANLPTFITSAMAQAAGDIALGDRRMPAMAMRDDGGRTIVAFFWDDLRGWCEALAEVGNAHKVHALGRQLEAIARELRSVS